VQSSTITRAAATGNRCWIDGVITGPDNGRARTEARLRGCTACGSAQCDGQTTSPCNAAQRNFYDAIEQSQSLKASSFVRSTRSTWDRSSRSPTRPTAPLR
jgi:hypothetical protein